MDKPSEDKIIGRGRTAAVYDIGDEKVLKLYYVDFPREACEKEFEIAESLNDAGLDVPRCHARLEIDGRFGIVYDRVRGASLLDELASSPRDLKKIARSFAGVQRAIHLADVPSLPSQKAELSWAIASSRDVLGERYEPTLARLTELEEGRAVCHGDFHPGNVLEFDGLFRTIDWMNAVRGNPLGDVARTWLLIKSPFMPDETPLFMRALSGILKGTILRIWLREYLSLSSLDFAAVRPWLLPYAAARLRENIPGERRWLLRLIDRELARG